MTPEQQSPSGCQAREARGSSHTRKQCGNPVTHWHDVYGELCADHVREMNLSGKCILIAERAHRLATCDERQRRVDHLALVAAPIYARLRSDYTLLELSEDDFVSVALDQATALQKAAEERVLKI